MVAPLEHLHSCEEQTDQAEDILPWCRLYEGKEDMKFSTSKTFHIQLSIPSGNWGLRTIGFLPSSLLAWICGQEPQTEVEETHQVQARPYL